MFGKSLPITPSTVYRVRTMNNGGGTGSTTNATEVGIKVTNFFDYGVDDTFGTASQYVSNYFWETKQNLFNNFVGDVTDGNLTFCRVRKVRVWALPKKGFSTTNPDAATSNAGAMYTVNVQTPGVSEDNAYVGSTNTRVTNVLPQVDTRWKEVFSIDMQKTFQSGVVRPFFADGQDGITKTAQCLFQMSIVNSVTGAPYYGDDRGEDVGLPKFRIKVEVEVDQPVAPLQTARYIVFRNDTFGAPAEAPTGTPYVPPTPEYCQMYITGMKNDFR